MTIPDEAGLVLVPGESIVVAAHGIGDARETLAEKCRFVVEVVLAATAVDDRIESPLMTHAELMPLVSAILM